MISWIAANNELLAMTTKTTESMCKSLYDQIMCLHFENRSVSKIIKKIHHRGLAYMLHVCL